MVECFLCLQAEQDIKECIQFDSSEWTENDIKLLIDKHLWVIETIKQNAWLCFQCWKHLKEFHKFYKRIEEAHKQFKSYTNTEDDKPKDIQLQMLLEPEIIIGKAIKAPIVIKRENLEDTVILTSLAQNNKEVTCYSKVLKDTYEHSDESSDDDIPLLHCYKNENISGKLPTLDTAKCKFRDSSEHKQEDCMENYNSDTDFDPLQTNKPARRKRCRKDKQTSADNSNTKRKSYYTPTSNRLEHDKFLQEHFKITCNKCYMPFETFPLLCKHYMKEHNERGFVTCCETKYFERRCLVKHIKYHLDPEYFKCKDCGRVLNTYSGLQYHMQTHKEPRFQCNACDKKFIEKIKLENHMTVHLPKEEKKYTCNECGKFFGNEAILLTHQRVIHLGVYAKVCELCGVTMPDTSSFKTHMKKHEENCFQVPCKECGLILAGPIQLKRHCKLRHPPDGKREYKCHICPKISPSLRALKKHIRCVHEMGYDFKCTICEKAFKRADNLKSHMLTHTKMHPYRCTWCPKAFNSDSNMYNHRKKAHPEEWLEARRQKYSGNLPPEIISSVTLHLKQMS